MSKTRSEHISLKTLAGQTIFDYLALIKMRLTTLVVFTAVASYIIATDLMFSGLDILFLAVGGFGELERPML